MSSEPQVGRPENPPVAPSAPAPRKTTWGCLWMLIILIIAAVAIWWFGFRGKQSSASTQPSGRHGGGGPVPGVAAPAQRGDMPIYLTGLGSAQALNTVTVRTRVDGELVQVAFKEGQFVHAGDLLV